MSQLATFTEFHDYFKAIATSHVAITGFKFGDKDVVRCGVRSDKMDMTLWVENYEPVIVLDSRSDNPNGTIRSAMVLMTPMPAKWDDQRTKYEQLETITKQIISKVWKEYNEGLCQAVFTNFKYGWAEVALGATEMLGCRLDVQFLRPERFEYDATKWA